MTMRLTRGRAVTCLVSPLVLLGLLGLAAAIPHNDQGPELDAILSRMASHDAWQTRHLVGYRVLRTLHAANARFKKQALLEVRTQFRAPSNLESQIIRSEGSTLIRERVFDRILEAETETSAEGVKKTISITPSNYRFALRGREDCAGRPCRNLVITPRQKSKYAIDGNIWVDEADGAIVRIHGSPAKRPSFWTRSAEIERRYRRIEGVWLCIAMESTSTLLIAGRSTLKIDYDYLSVQTESSPSTWRRGCTEAAGAVTTQPPCDDSTWTVERR